MREFPPYQIGHTVVALIDMPEAAAGHEGEVMYYYGETLKFSVSWGSVYKNGTTHRLHGWYDPKDWLVKVGPKAKPATDWTKVA